MNCDISQYRSRLASRASKASYKLVYAVFYIYVGRVVSLGVKVLGPYNNREFRKIELMSYSSFSTASFNFYCSCLG